jgi:alpha-L-fucosidase
VTTIYQPTWNSLAQHRTPQWFRDAKFGIYTHWGVYCVPACGPNATWYPYNMYREGTPQYAHHVKTYGGPEKFGYKDFIPQLTGERFDADEWAELFKRSGAQFAGPVGEHHDGFCMWDSRFTEWKATRMGPGRDVVGELERAIRKQDMRFMVALHHAENWWFFPHWRKEFDTSDPRYAGLYGELHDVDHPSRGFLAGDQQPPSRDFLDVWKAKIYEVIDRYDPDLLWFDFALGWIQERYKQEFLAYYYSQAEEHGKEVVVTYKLNHLPPNVAVLDHEVSRESGLTYHEWITDTTVDDGEAWGYVSDARYKSPANLVHYLVDNVSKNGYLLLNVGPKANGEIPEQARDLLIAMGKWLETNGEAIYGTTAWSSYGEGPMGATKTGPLDEAGNFNYTAQDIRFTVKDDALYAICLGWPGERLTIASFKALYPSEIASVRLLGVNAELSWSLTPDGLTIQVPPERPCEHAYVFKIARRHPFDA